jgi:quercetin dioxygenase-like cupin family protein
MFRFALAITLGVALGAGGVSLARHDEQGHGKVTKLSERDVIEKLDGKEARVTAVEVAYEPGEAGEPHRHPGPIFGYVLEGEFELGLGDEPVKTLKAGETFYEPTGILHRVSRNPGTKGRTRVLAVILHPREARNIVLPASDGPTE